MQWYQSEVPWKPLPMKSMISRLLIQQLVQTNIKENIEPSVIGWFPLQKASIEQEICSTATVGDLVSL